MNLAIAAVVPLSAHGYCTGGLLTIYVFLFSRELDAAPVLL